MADIQFADFSGLGSLMAMDRQSERDKLDRARLEKHDQWMQQDRADARDLQKLQYIDKLDEKNRARLKDTAEWTTQAAIGVLNAPPERRSEAYRMAIADGKARGFDLSTMPPEYSPGMEGQLQYYIDRGQPIHDYYKNRAEQPQAMPAPGGGAPAPGGAPAAPGAPPPDRAAFVQKMMPHALEVSRQTGLDPRLVLAQSILETGAGASAPGNNYFGIKSHGQPGGQTLATTEAGPNGALVPTQASFRTYADPGASAQDYINFVKDPRNPYGPVMAAQGLDAQIDAMGKSGYATDPNYAAKLRQIAQTIGDPQPTMGTPPASMVAQGANAAPMPGAPASLTPPGPPPANMPSGPQLAQAGGAPVIPQGGGDGPGQGDAPPRTGQGRTFPTTDGGAVSSSDLMTQVQLPPGATFVTRHGKVSKIGDNYEIKYQDGRLGEVRGPPKKEEAGPIAGTGLEGQMLNILLTGDPSTQQYAAAHAFVSRPRTAVDPTTQQVTIVPPMDVSMFAAPTFGRGGQPTGPAPLPAKTTQTQLPGGGVMTQIQGHGRPIPSEEYEKIGAGVVAVKNIDKALGTVANPTPDDQPSGRVAGFLSGTGKMGNQLAQEMDPKGTKFRAVIADVGSQLLQARSGLAVTEAEYNRLVAMLPSAMDDVPSITTKLNQVRSTLAEMIKQRNSQYTAKNGFIPHEGANEILGGSAPAAKSGTYMGPDNRPINWTEIEATAKNRGISTDEVINKLGLKPADAR